jgi:hypothetical protein
MTEQLQTRTEHSRSLEDAERYKAIEVLKLHGVLTPVANLESYHGRVRKPSEAEPWKVDSTFQNGGNDSGNDNVHNRSALYTSSLDVAQDFGAARSIRGTRGEAEAHRIVSEDLDATVIEGSYKYLQSFSSDDLEAVQDALKKLTIPLTQGAPLEFQDRDKINDFLAQVKTNPIQTDDLAEIVARSGMGEVSVRRLAGAQNSKWAIENHPSWAILQVLHHKEDDIDVFIDGKTLPFSIEYIQRFLREAHIVGVTQKPWSATLGRQIDSVSYFDLEQVNTPEEIQRKHGITQRLLGTIATEYGREPSEEFDDSSKELLNVLTNPYAKPRELVQASKKVKGFEDSFSMSTGVWEGYTLAEHTETVLRNLDENYTDTLPVALIPLMRLAIIGHDIGKPIAVSYGRGRDQDMYNAHYAEAFYKTIGLDEKKRELLLAIIGDGAKLMHQIQVNGSKEKVEDLKELARTTMGDFFDTATPSLDQMKGFARLCRILQVCDGGAYTSMAVTQSVERKVIFRNAGSFNTSFEPPVGPGKRDLRPRQRE